MLNLVLRFDPNYLKEYDGGLGLSARKNMCAFENGRKVTIPHRWLNVDRLDPRRYSSMHVSGFGPTSRLWGMSSSV